MLQCEAVMSNCSRRITYAVFLAAATTALLPEGADAQSKVTGGAAVVENLSGSLVKTGGDVGKDYRIGLGDVLAITVWKEPDISVPAATVRSDGKISVPLLKEIRVEGLTPTELQEELTTRLRKLVHEADVTVVVTAINSKKVYLLGAVRKEGPIVLQRPLTVLQAISEAGGFTEFAKTKRIYVLRRQNGQQVRLAYDYQAVIRGNNLQQDFVLLPDDTVVVPR